MLKKLLKKIAYKGIDDLAVEAWERGDAVFANRFFPSPSPRNWDADVAAAMARVEAIGWQLQSRQVEREGLQRSWSLLFVRPPLA
ncbi:hypothetical protein NEH83_10100 [Streptomyces sp. JUS-F4]|uniref:hypothetical protein n=1 Tax=Streptomyces TaxID=1883 RepID=UPI000A395688|nr:MULTISPECIES: hypothetical protein [Streptomyces]WKN14539.1 hypothetical protein NEH83_10100 [Streptomyces sp. JUS-F4]